MSLAAVAALSACETPTSPRPIERTAPPPAPKVVAYAPSQQSIDLSAYYTNVQQSLLIQGLLRTDGGGPDTPFNERQLVNNFVQIAAFNEFTLQDGQYINSRSEGRVQRWTQPVEVSLSFGRSVPEKQMSDDRKKVDAYVRRLSRVTGAPIAMTRGDANFHVAVLDVDELAAFGPTLQKWVPGMTPAIARQIIDMPRDIYCAVYAFSEASNQDEFVKAVAIVRAEHPDLLRLSCFHEEIAQGMGLSNDSPEARPSIFNDDDEFALLTRHDELLLKMLYDKRLPLGATPETTRPVAKVLASELLGGES
ncbi:MAG: DUF2927 domain-containing protein [Litoreibacter sp.]